MHSALQLVLMLAAAPLANSQSIAGGMACASVQISSTEIQIIKCKQTHNAMYLDPQREV